MANPKYRTSASRRNKRRSHHAIKLKSHSLCPNCGEVKYSHCVCEACGHYRGKQVAEPRQASFELDTNFDTGS